MPNGACSGQVCQAVWAQGAGRCQTNHPWRNRAISQFLLTVTPGQRLAVTRVCATHVTRWHMWHGDTYHTITHVTHITQGHSRHLLAMLTSRQICRALGSGINKMAIARRLLCRSCPNPEGFEFLIHRLVWIFCNSSFQLVYLSLDSHILIHACMYNVHGKALKHCISNS